jgi:8-oxo-dGTP pyrophosphatase MutT (NUDIX family)
VEKTDVVTAFLVRRPNTGVEVLVLRRSDKVGSYQGRWAGVSGYLEAHTPLEQALIEIEEETGIPATDVTLLAEAPPMSVRDGALGRLWRVHPLLFELTSDSTIRLDWEHTESRWIAPEAMQEIDTVPGLADAFASVFARWHSKTRAQNANVRGV